MSVSFPDRHYLDRAFELAEEALECGEVPVGCVIVLPSAENKSAVISEGRNEVNATKNATRHAEIVAIDRLLSDDSSNYESSIFSQCTLYVTVEPCILCADALLKVKMKRIVFCCRNERFGGFGSVFDVRTANSSSSTELVSIDEEELTKKAVGILQRFYSGENPNAPTPKVKGKRMKTPY